MESKDVDFLSWLDEATPAPIQSVTALPGDASVRRYFRIQTKETSYIGMDASLQRENVKPFVVIAKSLRDAHIHTPQIYAEDLTRGYLLLEDFGDTILLDYLTETNMEACYKQALEVLFHIQSVRGDLKPFDATWMQQEWRWHKEWFLEKWLNVSYAAGEKKLDDAYAAILHHCTHQPYVFMHRDFHSANLMVLKDGSIGVLDFQDAFMGPLTYDAASLLRDCYIAWPEDKVSELLQFYFNRLNLKGMSFDEFKRGFDWMSIQRHLKALLTFARKAVRDCDTTYLQYIPRTLQSIITTSAAYPELTAIHDFYLTTVLPKIKSENFLCVP